MKSGYIIERGLFLNFGYIHVFNWIESNLYGEYIFDEIIKKENCIGCWKLKTKK